MLELDDESKIINEICSWLPSGLDGQNVCGMFTFRNLKFGQNFQLLRPHPTPAPMG